MAHHKLDLENFRRMCTLLLLGAPLNISTRSAGFLLCYSSGLCFDILGGGLVFLLIIIKEVMKFLTMIMDLSRSPFSTISLFASCVLELCS